MSLLHESKVCYSNACHYPDADDTFEASQARQAAPFVKDLIEHQWLSASREILVAKSAPVPMSIVKQKADNLLRMTKSNALKRLRA